MYFSWNESHKECQFEEGCPSGYETTNETETEGEKKEDLQKATRQSFSYQTITSHVERERVRQPRSQP